MANKKNWLGMLIIVLVLVFGMSVVGCDDLGDENEGYAFEFKVESYNYTVMPPMVNIEFFNGSTVNSSIISKQAIYINVGDLSDVIKVSGFTEKHEDKKNIYGVRITYEDGQTHFRWGSAENKSKIIVYGNSFAGLIFRNGEW